MIRLDTFEKAPQGYGAPRSSWFNNLINHARSESIKLELVYECMTQIVAEYGGVWARAERTDGRIALWPEYLDFEDEGQATMFLLRWA